MRYEGIACYSFDCDWGQDSKGISYAGFFDGEFMEELTKEGLEAMYSIIDELIIKVNDAVKTESLKVVRESLKVGMDQASSIELLDYIITILKE